MTKRRAYRRWALYFLCFFAIVTASVMLINFAVDPMWCFNHETPYAQWREFISERQQKTNLLRFRDFPIDTLVIGSSRVMAVDSAALKTENCFNMGFSSCQAFEYEDILKIFYKTRGSYPDKIFLGLDFFGVGTTYADGETENKSDAALESLDSSAFLYRLETLASIELARKGVKLLKKNYENDVEYGDTMFFANHMEASSYYPPQTDLQAKKRSYDSTFLDFRRGYDFLDYDPRYKEYLSNFTKLTETKVFPFITPEGTPFLRYIAETPGRVDDYERMVREAVDVFGGVWNFMYVNSVTSNHEFWREPSHHLHQVDEWIIAQMTGRGGAPEDFGIYVTKDNIDEHLEAVRRQFNELPATEDSWKIFMDNDDN